MKTKLSSLTICFLSDCSGRTCHMNHRSFWKTSASGNLKHNTEGSRCWAWERRKWTTQPGWMQAPGCADVIASVLVPETSGCLPPCTQRMPYLKAVSGLCLAISTLRWFYFPRFYLPKKKTQTAFPPGPVLNVTLGRCLCSFFQHPDPVTSLRWNTAKQAGLGADEWVISSHCPQPRQIRTYCFLLHGGGWLIGVSVSPGTRQLASPK